MEDESRLIDLARQEIDAIAKEAPVTAAHIEGYRLLSEIHRGAQGVVYRAVQQSTGQNVAVKVMREGPHAGEVDRARFEREVKILAQLKHPNIVSILDTGSSAGSFFFVMDYINGQPLDVYMAGAEHSVHDALLLFAEICKAIQAAHVRGIIHRDIKPGNILIDESGKPHVLDFGLAKVEEDDAPMMTMTGQFVGSIPWSSPEQADAPSLVDVRSDVYALGVILFQMLTARFPYDVTGNLRDVLDRIARVEPIRPRTLRSDIDDELQTLMLMCLAKDPDRRYQTAGELARDVESYLAGDPIAAKRDSTWYLLSKHFKRHRIAMAVAAAFLLVITAGFLASFTFWQEAERNRVIADSARKEAVAAQRQAETQAHDAERVNSWFENLFESAAPLPLGAAQFASQQDAQLPTLLELLERGSQDVALEFGDSPRVEAKVRNILGGTFLQLGQPEKAREELEHAFEIRSARLGPKHPETLRTSGLLGTAFVYTGDTERAEQYLVPAVGHMASLPGEGLQDTLRFQSALGHVVIAQGRVDEGRRILLELKTTIEDGLQNEDGDFLDLSFEPAYWLNAVGETEAAAELVKHSREASVRIYGIDHDNTRTSDRVFTRLGSRRHMRRGQPSEMNQAMEREFGPEGFAYVVTTDTNHDVEIVRWGGDAELRDAGQSEEAARAARESVARLERVLPAEHPDVLAAKGRLAWEMRSVPALLPEAESLARETLAISIRLKGEQDLDTLLNQQTLGVLLHLQGRSKEADALLGDLLVRARQCIPEDDGVLFLFEWTHSAALREVERDGRAQEVLREGCEGMLRTLGPDNDKTRRALIELALLSEELRLADDAQWARDQLAPDAGRTGEQQG